MPEDKTGERSALTSPRFRHHLESDFLREEDSSQSPGTIQEDIIGERGGGFFKRGQDVDPARPELIGDGLRNGTKPVSVLFFNQQNGTDIRFPWMILGKCEGCPSKDAWRLQRIINRLRHRQA